uniref:Uncharacterized protein n=1 Tax=Oxyrrhis marina TaxID=2969 RepID=A0A7S4GQ35_OXYMA
MPDPVPVQPEASEPSEWEIVGWTAAELAAKKLIPLVQRHEAVKKTLQDRLLAAQTSTRDFLGDTGAGVNKEIFAVADVDDSKELFCVDKDTSARMSSMPPLSVLVAGAFAPLNLSCFRWGNLANLLVAVALLALFLWAVIADMFTGLPCDIPTLWYWAFTMCAILALMVLVRLILQIQTEVSIATVNGLVASEEERLRPQTENYEAGALTLLEKVSYFKEVIVSQVTISSRAWVLWDSVSSSKWAVVQLMLVAAFLIAGFWGFLLLVGYMIVPGQVAFHPAAMGHAAMFCGSWRIVLTANIFSIVFSVLLVVYIVSLVINTASVMSETRGVRLRVMRIAGKLDHNLGGGLPLATTFARAFVIREAEDLLRLKLADAQYQHSLLETKRADNAAKLAEAKAKLEGMEQKQALLEEKVAAGPTPKDFEADIENYEHRCEAGIEELEEQVARLRLDDAPVENKESLTALKVACDQASGGKITEWEKQQAEARAAAEAEEKLAQARRLKASATAFAEAEQAQKQIIKEAQAEAAEKKKELEAAAKQIKAVLAEEKKKCLASIKAAHKKDDEDALVEAAVAQYTATAVQAAAKFLQQIQDDDEKMLSNCDYAATHYTLAETAPAMAKLKYVATEGYKMGVTISELAHAEAKEIARHAGKHGQGLEEAAKAAVVRHVGHWCHICHSHVQAVRHLLHNQSATLRQLAHDAKSDVEKGDAMTLFGTLQFHAFHQMAEAAHAAQEQVTAAKHVVKLEPAAQAAVDKAHHSEEDWTKHTRKVAHDLQALGKIVSKREFPGFPDVVKRAQKQARAVGAA